MGAASMMGLGLALARPDKHVLVVTGDGELLMSLGSLAVVALKNPSNLSIVCVDNGHYGETGYQKTHTSQGTNLEAIAAGCGISRTMTVEDDSQIGTASQLIRQANGASFVLLRVAPTDSVKYRVNLDGPSARFQFRKTLSSKR
jgi:phosphonopyruvate decarboxylase